MSPEARWPTRVSGRLSVIDDGVFAYSDSKGRSRAPHCVDQIGQKESFCIHRSAFL